MRIEMKRIPILIIIALTAVAGCSHPFEEGMTGSFPFIELASSNSLSFKASKPAEGAVQLRTNMAITTNVDYTTGTASGWISNIKTESDDHGTVTVKFKVAANESRKSRQAEIKILADKSSTNISVSVRQNGYVLEPGKEVTHEGDLYLRTQEEVEDCIYTTINGKLYIEGYDIYDISSLAITSIRDGLVISGCQNLSSLSPLNGLDIASLTVSSSDWSLLSSWYGDTRELYLRDIWGSAGSGVFRNFSNLETLSMENCNIDDFADAGITELTALKTLTLRNNGILDISWLISMTQLETVEIISQPDLSMAQVRYVQQYLGNTLITAYSLGGSTDTSVSVTSADTYSVTLQMYKGTGYSFRGTLGIIWGERDTPFTECTDIELEQFSGSGYATHEITGLKDATDYKVWSYLRDGEGKMYLSECTEFRTVKATFAELTFNMEYPSFADGTASPSFSSLAAVNAVVEDNGTVTETAVSITEDGSSHKAIVEQGQNNIFILASNGIYSGMQTSFRKSTSGLAVMEITDNSQGGFADDYAIGCWSGFVTTDTHASVSFTRTAALVSVNVDFSGCTGSLDDITGIDITLDGLYNKVLLDQNGTITYEGNRSYLFGKTVRGVQGNEHVASSYIMPGNGSGLSGTLTIKTAANTFVFTVMMDGQEISANHIYSLSIPVVMNRADGTFTLEDVIFVDGGEIEL